MGYPILKECLNIQKKENKGDLISINTEIVLLMIKTLKTIWRFYYDRILGNPVL